ADKKSISLYTCIVYLLLEKQETKESLIHEVDVPDDVMNKLSLVSLIEPASENISETMAVKYSFPEWMINEWIKSYGNENIKDLCSSLNTQGPMTIRVNTIKTTVEECQKILQQDGIETERTQLSPFGLHLKKRVNLFQLQAFKDGFFEVQDEGSQLLSLLVDPKPRGKVIDACAGAGGKALAMATVMKNRGEIFAMDIHSFRLGELRKRIKRSGVDIIRVKTIRENDVVNELVGTVDTVLVDAPCSGTGTIRRNPGMKWTVTEKMIDEMHGKQLSILSLNAQYVKPNGRLIYATCSLMKHENEEVVESFLSQHPNFELLSPASILERYQLASLGNNKYFQLLPHQFNTDGFFAAVMKRMS
ncbi:MAG: hypothetical protein PHP42_11505, partial [Bacteroidota bacterium]|nr:hypothetical protein [Bacteroidota bacterium]